MLRKCLRSFNYRAMFIQQNQFKQTIRYNSFLSNELITSHERTFKREVLQRTDGCSLFSPYHLGKLDDDLLQRDDVIESLIELSWKFIGNKFKYQSNSVLSEHLLPPLDIECVEKCDQWSAQQKLFAMDIWHSYFQMSKSIFFSKMMIEFLHNFDTLPDSSALQIMFYVSDTKWKLKSSDEKRVIRKMKQILEYATLNEISVYCSALVRCESKIENVNFVKSLFQFVQKQDLMKQNDIAVTCVLKAIRHFATSDHNNDIKALQEKLLPFAEKTNLIGLTHIVQLGFKQRVYNQKLVVLVIQRFLVNLNKLRLKDVERLALIISTFDIKTSDRIEEQFCKTVQEYLKKSFKTNFPLSLIRCISYLATNGLADMDLIDHALKRSIQVSDQNVDEVAHNLLVIDSIAKVNLANAYKGYKLSDDFVSKLVTKSYDFGSAKNQHELLTDLMNIFESNKHHCLLTKAIPHFVSPDVLFIYNRRTNKTVELIEPKKNNRILTAADFHGNNPDLVAVALVSCLQRQTIFNSNKYHRLFQLKLDQLKLLGFDVLVLKQYLWKSVGDIDAKHAYLSLQLCKQNIFLFNEPFNLNKAFPEQ